MGFALQNPSANGAKGAKPTIRRVDIRLMPMESFVAAVVYFTGSYALNITMRKLANKQGYVLNEYGLYKKGEAGVEAVDLESEEHLFELLGMPYLHPTERSM